MPPSQEHALRSASALLGRKLRLLEAFTAGQHATTILTSDGEDEFVIRAFPRGHDTAAREPEALARLAELRECAPRLVAHRADLADPLVITSRVPGTAPTPALSASTIAREMAGVLVRIHSLDGTCLPEAPARPPAGDSAIARRARSEFASLLIEDRVLSHGDFWVGNALWTGDRLTGVVDWAGACHAPRGVDLAWCRQDLVLLGAPEAAAEFLAEYERLLGRRISDIADWDLQAAASAVDRVETWLPNYLGIGLTEMTAELLRERLDRWNALL